MRWTCAECPDPVEGDLEDVARHVTEWHGYDVDRWPDGRPVVEVRSMPAVTDG